MKTKNTLNVVTFSQGLQNKSLHLKCSRLDKKDFLNIFKEILNLFVYFAHITPVTTVISMFIMGENLPYAMAVKTGLIKNVWVSQYMKILGFQQIVMKLGPVGPASHKCFLSSV